MSAISIFESIDNPRLLGFFTPDFECKTLNFRNQGRENVGYQHDNSVEIVHVEVAPVPYFGEVDVYTYYPDRKPQYDTGIIPTPRGLSAYGKYYREYGYTAANKISWYSCYYDKNMTPTMEEEFYWMIKGRGRYSLRSSTYYAEGTYHCIVRGYPGYVDYPQRWIEVAAESREGSNGLLENSIITDYKCPNHPTYGTSNGVPVPPRYRFNLEGYWIEPDTHNLLNYVYSDVAVNHPPTVGVEWELFSRCMSQMTSNTNTWANVTEIGGLIMDIRKYGPGAVLKPDSVKDFKTLLKFISSQWLSYRYSYCTTKSDIKEYSRVIKQVEYLNKNKYITYHSACTDTHGSYGFKVDLNRRPAPLINDILTKMRQLGLDPSAYNLWDMVPLSFVADWFVSLGDWYEDVSSNWMRDTVHFDFDSITFSHRVEGLVHGNRYKYYRRSILDSPPPILEYIDDVENSTVIKRAIDGLSMILTFKRKKRR